MDVEPDVNVHSKQDHSTSFSKTKPQTKPQTPQQSKWSWFEWVMSVLSDWATMVNDLVTHPLDSLGVQLSLFITILIHHHTMHYCPCVETVIM